MTTYTSSSLDKYFSPITFNTVFGYSLVDASAAVAQAIEQRPWANVSDLGSSNWGLDRVKALEVWNQRYTGQGIVVAEDDFNFKTIRNVGKSGRSLAQMQTHTQQAISGSTPDGFYDLTWGNDNFQITPGLLAGSPQGLRALDGNDTVEGSSVGDMMNGNQGDDFLGGNGGNDLIWGGKGADLVYGDNGDDTLNGNMDRDFVAGGAGNDLIRGGKDGDNLMGEGGDDTLMGDLGVDVLIGGAGSDRFELRNNSLFEFLPQDSDYILDFNRFSDRIVLPGFISEANLTLTQENISMSSIGLTSESRQSYIQLAGVDIDPNGDGIISGTRVAQRTLLSNSLLTLGFVVNVTPADLSGRFVSSWIF